MLRRRQINADRARGRLRARLSAGDSRLRSGLGAASAPVRDAAGAFEERVLWRLSDLLRAVFDVVRWPFERLAWAAEQRLLWPVQERLGLGALAALAIGAVVATAVLLGGGDGGEERFPAAEPVVSYAPAPAPERAEPSGPELHGVAPEFGVGEGVGVGASSGERGAGDEAAPDSFAGDEAAGAGAAPAGASAPTAEAEAEAEAGATTSSRKPAPAGPAAMKVARRFSEAFVFYEIGERPARAISVFEETATPELATALAERPPRQPASTEVPKARVLNLVPGPRRGKVYTVSASLLRVGTISELRLKMTRQEGAWVVTDVRG